MLRAPAMRRLVALALLALSSAALASAQQTNSTQNATSSTPAAPAPPTTPPAATITVITPSQCELENRRIMDQDWGPYQKMLRDCEYFIRTGLRVHCTSECAYRARVFADLVAANAGLRTCVLGDPKSRTIVNLFAKQECGRRSPKLEGADVVYDSDGNPLTFRGAPDYEAEKGLSFVHPNDHPAPDTTPVIRNQQPLATTQKHVQAQIAQGNNAPQLNGTTNAAPRTNASGSGNVTVSNPPKFRAVNGTVTNGTAASNSTSNATSNATSPADANAKIDRNADPNTWNWEGKPVRPINRTNVGRPLSPKQIELISPIDDGKGFFLPGAVANTAFGRNQTALTREEVAICVGPLGPLQRVRSGCSVFLNRVPSALLFPLEQTVDSNANVSATSTQKEINALNAHKKAMAKSWEAYKTCPDDCTNALRFFRLVVDGAFHVSKCLRLKTYAHTFTALRNTVCDPIRVGLVPGGRFSAIPDPLDAPNIALKQPMPERITRRSYVGRLSMPPPRKPEKVRNDNLNQFRVPGVNTTANVSALLLGGGNVGASRAAPKTGENNATQVASLESIRAFKGWNGLEPAEDYGLPTAETDAYAKAGFCRGDGVNFEIGPDGTPRYCKPRPPKIKLDRGGKVVYDAQRGPRINYDAFLRLDKSGKPVYPRPLKTNSKIRRTTYERAEDYKKLQKVLSKPEHKPRAEVDSLLVNITQYGRGVNRGVPKVSADELLQKLALAADNPQTMEDTEFQALIRQILDNKGTATNGSVVSNTTDIAGIVANASAAANASSNATVVSRASGSVHSLLRSLANAEQFETGYNGLEKDRIEFGASTRYTHDKRFQAINVGANATSNATTNATEPFPPQSNSTHTVSLVNVTIAGTELSYQAPYVLTNETIEEITVRKRVRNVPRPVPKPDNATDVLMSIEDEERFRTFFSHKLASLATAGYTDEKRNLRLLIKYHGDINKVLAVLTGNAKYADLNDVDDAALPQPRINVTRQVNLTVPIELANLTLPELLTRPQDPATNTTNSTAPAAPANTVNVSSPITTAIKVTGEDLKKAGVPYYFTSEKPVDIFDEAFSNGSQ